MTLGPSWLFPGNGDVFTGGVMSNTPLFPLWVSALRTLSHTTGHWKGELGDANSAVSNSSSMIIRSSMKMRIQPFLGSSLVIVHRF